MELIIIIHVNHHLFSRRILVCFECPQDISTIMLRLKVHQPY